MGMVPLFVQLIDYTLNLTTTSENESGPKQKKRETKISQ